MEQTMAKFELMYGDIPVWVQEMIVSDRNIFVVRLDGQHVIVIARAINAAGERFWTCIPENKDKQKLALEIGRLIEIHIKKTA
jgi:hypothetical protein